MKKITKTERQIKDLSFLLALPKQENSPGIIKRIEVNGTGDAIKDIKIPCYIYLSLQKYDYEGKFHSHSLNICIKDFSKRSNPDISQGVYQAVQTMKLQQKSWFNFQSPELHRVDGLSQEGCHFYIVIDDIKYKNSETLQSKKFVSEQLRKQASGLFKNGDYEEALKRYRKQINISEGIDKKKYSESQLQEIIQINRKAKKNFLKCFAKLSNFDNSLSEIADGYSKQLLKIDSTDVSYLYLRAQVLMQRKYLTLALQLAQQVQKKSKDDGDKLIQQIEQRIKKNK